MLDKNAVREMLVHYRSWSTDEERARADDAIRRSPEENLRDFIELCEFCVSLQDSPPPVEPRLEWNAYYEKAARLEIWRSMNGKRP